MVMLKFINCGKNIYWKYELVFILLWGKQNW